MTNKKIFRILSIYTMAVIFLPIIVNNIPPPFNILTSKLLLGIIWLLFIFIFHPNILVSKYMITIYLFYLILVIGSFTIWNDSIIIGVGSISIKWIIVDIYGVFLGVLMYLYFLESADYSGLASISLIALSFILFTSITSIIGVSLFPGAVRKLASSGVNPEVQAYQKLGIANYGYFAAIIYLFPILIYYIKQKTIKIKFRIYLTTYTLILLYSLVKAEFTTALVLAILFTTLSIVTRKRLRATTLVIVVFFSLSFFYFSGFFAETFYWLANSVNSEVLKFRFNDVGKVLEFHDFDPNSGTTYFSKSRLSLVMLSLEKFLMNPLFGGGWGGGHSTWIDRLGFFGLLGFFSWIVIFSQQIKLNLLRMNNSYKSYYLLSIISCITLGIITTSANSLESGVVLFLLIPGMNFLGHLKKTHKMSKRSI